MGNSPQHESRRGRSRKADANMINSVDKVKIKSTKKTCPLYLFVLFPSLPSRFDPAGLLNLPHKQLHATDTFTASWTSIGLRGSHQNRSNPKSWDCFHWPSKTSENLFLARIIKKVTWLLIYDLNVRTWGELRLQPTSLQ